MFELTTLKIYYRGGQWSVRYCRRWAWDNKSTLASQSILLERPGGKYLARFN
jgi:hypothetical protein